MSKVFESYSWMSILLCFQDQKQPQEAIVHKIKDQPVESKIAHKSLMGSITKEQEDVRKKYNLNRWKYAELRDTINTSVGRCTHARTHTYTTYDHHTPHMIITHHIWSSHTHTHNCIALVSSHTHHTLHEYIHTHTTAWIHTHTHNCIDLVSVILLGGKQKSSSKYHCY